MAGLIRLKVGGMVEGMQENVLAKEFFGSAEVDRGQVSGPQVPLLGRWDDEETPNWACRYSWTGYGLSGGWSTSRRWPRPGHWTTGASSGPWIQDRVPELGEPWGYAAPVVAAVMTRATGVRHIYLIMKLIFLHVSEILYL